MRKDIGRDVSKKVGKEDTSLAKGISRQLKGPAAAAGRKAEAAQKARTTAKR